MEGQKISNAAFESEHNSLSWRGQTIHRSKTGHVLGL